MQTKGGHVCGGFGEFLLPDDELNEFFEAALPLMKEEYARKFDAPKDIKFLGCHKQIVSGTNYKMKTDIDGEIVWFKIHESLPCYGGEINVSGVAVGENSHKEL